MQLNNVKKKIEKSADKIGIEPGEVIRAACTTNPSGTMKRMMAKELGGVLGALAADRSQGGSDGDEAGGPDQLSARFPTGQHYLVLTDRRLLVFSVTTMTGKPKELQAEWPADQVLGITTDPGKLAIPMAIAFADGSAVQVEAARGTGAETLSEQFSQPGQLTS